MCVGVLSLFKPYQLFSDSVNFCPELRLWPLSAFNVSLGLSCLDILTADGCALAHGISVYPFTPITVTIYYLYITFTFCNPHYKVVVVVAVMTARGQHDLRIALGNWTWLVGRAVNDIDWLLLLWSKRSQRTLYNSIVRTYCLSSLNINAWIVFYHCELLHYGLRQCKWIRISLDIQKGLICSADCISFNCINKIPANCSRY